MDTTIEFENLSLNTNIRQIGIVPRLDTKPVSPPRVWDVISNCQYSWRHPFTIPWVLSCRLTDRTGQTFGPFAASDARDARLAKLGITLSGSAQELSVEAIPDTQVHSVTFCIGNRPATWPLRLIDRVFARLSEAATLIADVEKDEDLPRHAAAFGPRGHGTRLDLAGVRTARVAMQGGAPGPRSDPIRFIAYGHKTW